MTTLTQKKISISSEQNEFLENFKQWGFTDQSSIVREALTQFIKEVKTKQRKSQMTEKAKELLSDYKTDKELKIIWDETFYVHDGGMSGGFMFEGIPYEDRNKPKSPTVLAANGSLTMKIWPSDLAFYHQFEKAAVGFDEGTWIHNELKPGQNGMLLTVKVGERVINEKITVNISVQEVK